jgi:hypothetical protein
MSAPAESAGADTSRSCPHTGESRALVAGVAVFLAASLAVTLWRLRVGADLVDEAFSVLVPWRWALGDRPFVDEQNLSQAAGLLAYPFMKAYAAFGGTDAAGLVLFGRHLNLGIAIGAAACVVLLARRSLPAVLSALVAAPVVTVVLFETPQVTANTLAALLLAAGAALGGVTVLGGSRRYALAAGVAYGLAGIAYPTLLLMAPFVGVFLAGSVGDRGTGMLARGALPSSGPGATGRSAWRAVSSWALGLTCVVIPALALVTGIAGVSNLRRSWHYTLGVAETLDQLGGASKAVEVTSSFFALLTGEWYIVVAALVSLLVFRARPSAGRWLLLLTPPALWVTATTGGLRAAGAAIVFALAAPYLYVFVPRRRREDGARLLVWIWPPALLLGAMTAYTSADGLERAAVGLFPGLVLSGLFLAWGLQPLRLRDGGAPWPAALGLAAVVLATLAMQVQFQHGGASLGDLSERMPNGPWRGIAVTPDQRAHLSAAAADLARQERPGDLLLVYPQGAAVYLSWPGEIAANTYQLYSDDPKAPLPKATVSYYRRHREAPTLVTHLMRTEGRSAAELTARSGGLEYPAVVVRPGYAMSRRPPADTVADVLRRLPRLE